MSNESQSRLDRAIDRTVRQMLDVEPPAGLRGRVMQRIDPRASAPVASGISRKLVWTGLPLAAAAAIILAVLVLPGPTSQPQGPATVANDPRPPRVDAAAPPRVTPPVTTTARGEPPSPRRAETPETPRRGVIVAANDATDVIFGPDPGFPRVSPLNVAPLTISTLRTEPAAAPPHDITPDPIATPAPLHVEPLPLSPRERQEQE